jgi:hypothetical protein
VKGSVLMQAGIVGGKFDDVAESIFGAGEGAVEAEGYGAVGDKLESGVIDLDGGSLFGAAGHQADGGELSLSLGLAVRGGFAEANIVGARQAAADQDAASGGADVGVIGGAASHREIEIDVLEDFGTAAVPMADGIGHALAQNFGDEETAIEEDGIGNLACRFQKRVQVAGDGGIGNIRKAEFAEQIALLFLGRLAAGT